jgi:hypothetical protein
MNKPTVAWDFMRILRSAWVLFTSGTAIYLLYAGTRQDALLNHLLEYLRSVRLV